MGNTPFYIFAVLLFLAVVLAVEGIYYWWSSQHSAAAKRVKARIRALSAGGNVDREHISILKSRLLSGSPGVERMLLRMPRVHALDLLIQQSGLSWSVAHLLMWMLVHGLGLAMLVLLLPLTWRLAVPAGLIGASLPALYVSRRRGKRLERLERQLPETADTIARALRAGHAFPAAIEMIGNEMAEPIGGEFRIMFDEINYGVGINDALRNLATRVPIDDLRYFITAVMIQRESGGNLAEIMTNIAELTRERLKLLQKVRVLSAEGRLSAIILEVLPFGAAGLLMIVNPTFLEVLWKDPAGIKISVTALGLMALGMLWMRRIVRIHV
ncbi:MULTISPECIES: type II secretion system F family protein [Pandoraea]|uniref:Pilus assembly protein TadB n=1 Tax=Pandoraea communis TaxID=2508297 RepID=A0A5E4RES6_9BURK|nr:MULTISPECIES: type II secretion system F family protein [Pandoraea]EON13727.1 type II secretion system protein [Pandoraea sp. SD6-2]VVD61333.1 pilus assembly protein TadB [Pandoraea communis]